LIVNSFHILYLCMCILERKYQNQWSSLYLRKLQKEQLKAKLSKRNEIMKIKAQGSGYGGSLL
jgi:hypothetical protein